MAIVPNLPSVPVLPLLMGDSGEYGMFEHFKRFPWVLPVYQYNSIDDLVLRVPEVVIGPAEEKVLELRATHSDDGGQAT